MRARHNLHTTAALPHAPRHLQILAAPDAHGRIVCANLRKVPAVHGEQTAGHGWRRKRLDDRCVAAHPLGLSLRLHVPPKVQLPIEGARVQLKATHIAEIVIGDDVDDRTGDRLA